MKIIITRAKSAFSVDGINFFLWELANELILQGHEVFVVSGLNNNQIDVKEMFDIEWIPEVICLRQRSRSINKLQAGAEGIFNWFRHCPKILHEIVPDIIICNEAVPIFYPNFKAVICHDLENRFIGRKFYDIFMYRLFDKVITTSEELKENVTTELKLKPDKIVKIPLCINTKKYVRFSLDEREHAILHIGTWVDKNLQATLNAFQLLAKEDAQLKLYIIGDLWSWPKKLLSSINKETAKRIICLGRVPKKELRHIYSKVKVACVPSAYRAPVLSPTVLEAIASGTPVVGSSIGISKDILINGYNGFRVHPKDYTTMAKKISSLINDDELWYEMSINAANIAKSFDTPKVARMYIDLHKLR